MVCTQLLSRAAVLCLLLLAAPAFAADQPDPEAAIRSALTNWMTAFNARDAAGACGLFAPGLTKEQTYTDMCERLHRSLAGHEVGFRYSLDINEIIVSGDLAVVRLTWHLTVSRPGVPDVVTPETGLDVFRRQDDGSWKIIRFISYGAQT